MGETTSNLRRLSMKQSADARQVTCLFAGGRQAGARCLSHLVSRSEDLDLRIVGVLDSGNLRGRDHVSVAQIAGNAGIPILTWERLELELPVDFLLSVQYDRIFPDTVLRQVRRSAVNMHMAPLPEYRGASQFAFAILERASVFGATLHEMSVGVDSGPILAERRFEVPQDVFASELYDLTTTTAVELFEDTLHPLIADTLTKADQSEFVDRRSSSYHRKGELDDLRRIPGTLDRSEQLLRFRATYFPPFPPPVLLDGGKECELDMSWYHKTLALEGKT